MKTHFLQQIQKYLLVLVFVTAALGLNLGPCWASAVVQEHQDLRSVHAERHEHEHSSHSEPCCSHLSTSLPLATMENTQLDPFDGSQLLAQFLPFFPFFPQIHADIELDSEQKWSWRKTSFESVLILFKEVQISSVILLI